MFFIYKKLYKNKIEFFSNDVPLKKNSLMIMSIAMVAMLAFGGTFAYFTASATGGTKTLTTGTVMLTAGTEIKGSATVVPLSEVTSAITYTNKSDVAIYAFVTLSLELADGETLPTGYASEKALVAALFNVDLTDGSLFSAIGEAGYEGVYAASIAAGAQDATNGDTLTFADSITIKNVNSESVDTTAGDLMELSFTLTVKGDAIQAEGLASAKLAYDALVAQRAAA